MWLQLVELHNASKALFIYAEETGKDMKSFLQPNNEFKNALEHIIRAKARELCVAGETEPDSKYCTANLESALGHEYRAFFDICDWLSANLRDRVIVALRPFDHATISAVLPNYYATQRPKLDKISANIAKIRGSKDIGNPTAILDEVRRYQEELGSLIDVVAEIEKVIPSLEEHRLRLAQVDKRTKHWDVIKLLLVAAVGAVLTLVVKAFSD